MERYDRTSLSYDDRHLLETVVLPRFKKWMRDHEFTDSLFQHGLDAVLKWGAEMDDDIAERYMEFLRDKKYREHGGAMPEFEWQKHIRCMLDLNPDMTSQQMLERERNTLSPKTLPLSMRRRTDA